MTTTRRHQAITLQQAVSESPGFARLAELARDSGNRLKAIEALIPATLRNHVQPGPVEDGTWCLIVDSNSVAAKLRQALPALLAHLRSKGWEITSIRLKVQMRRPLHPGGL